MFFRFFLLIFTIGTGVLSGHFKDHLKTAHGKRGFHKMENVDFIYIINLDKRPEKFASCTQQLSKFRIFPYRFSAINGWELPLDVVNDLGVRFREGMTPGLMGTYFPLDGKGNPVHEIMSVPGRNYFTHNMSLGAIGCALSHLSVLQDAFDSKYKTIWVMEDDIDVRQDPHLISEYIERLDSLVGEDGWDMLFTDEDTISNETGDHVICASYAPRPNFSPEDPERFAQRIKVTDYFRKIGARYGMYSIIIRRSGIKKILRFIKQYDMFLPIDMEFYLPSDIRIYTVLKDIVSTKRNAPSDNSKPGFLKKEYEKTQRW
jgi:GR25 family glycosyltransferase involved in LPS biosynthesis